MSEFVSRGTDAAAAPPSSAGAVPRIVPPRLILRLEVTDPEVLAELRRHAEGDERDRHALAALRVGVLALRAAGGQLDASAVREAGQKLLADVRELLSQRAAELTGQVATTLARYFDPGTGEVPRRLDALVRRDGELERVLRAHVDADDSLLARTLTAQVGRDSPIFRMLSPGEAGGLLAQVAAALDAALAEQRAQVLREFSLDHKDSALARLLGELGASQGRLHEDLRGQVDAVVREFSLDHADSALSRLVGRVDAAQRAIADQFSADNDASALNKLSRLLQATSDQIGRNLTLDDDGSALARLRRELLGSIDTLAQRNQEFHAQVRATLASLQTRREADARSTRHGLAFEAQLGAVLADQARRLVDVHEALGLTTGAIRHCRKGDHLIELGRESAAPGARIVWEAKAEAGWDLRRALAEIEEARKNRQAQLGVFVFARRVAPERLEPLARHGDDLVIVWDDQDAATDVYVQAAYSIARALAVRVAARSDDSARALDELDRAARAVERQTGFLQEVRTWAETAESNGRKIKERVERMQQDLADEVARLDAQLAALRSAPPATGT